MILAAVNPTMSTLIFGSFLDAADAPLGISPGSTFSAMAIDGSDNLIVTGTTVSRDFPTTTGSFEPELPPANGSTFAPHLYRQDQHEHAGSVGLPRIFEREPGQRCCG